MFINRGTNVKQQHNFYWMTTLYKHTKNSCSITNKIKINKLKNNNTFGNPRMLSTQKSILLETKKHLTEESFFLHQVHNQKDVILRFDFSVCQFQ